MITRKPLLLIYSLFISLFLWGCGASAEYTSAKMAIDKKNWTEAEEYLFKALEAVSYTHLTLPTTPYV